MISRRLLALGAFAASLIALPVQAQDYDPDRLISGVSADDLKAIIGSLDHEVLADFDEGDPIVFGRSGNGQGYLLFGTACSYPDGKCRGVDMQLHYKREEVDPATIVQANFAERAVSTYYDEDEGAVIVARYAILDGGITMKNLRTNLELLLLVGPNAAAHVR